LVCLTSEALSRSAEPEEGQPWLSFQGLANYHVTKSSLKLHVNNNFITILGTLEDYINFASNSCCNQ
jgi:hypothetical protein